MVIFFFKKKNVWIGKIQNVCGRFFDVGERERKREGREKKRRQEVGMNA